MHHIIGELKVGVADEGLAGALAGDGQDGRAHLVHHVGLEYDHAKGEDAVLFDPALQVEAADARAQEGLLGDAHGVVGVGGDPVEALLERHREVHKGAVVKVALEAVVSVSKIAVHAVAVTLAK